MSADWTSYDSAAATHDRLRVPKMFARPALDLAARMELATARDALDVGTGSGVVACAMAVCPHVVGLDPSIEMLRLARRNGVARVAVGAAPGLPFADRAFDRVTAAFVLSHVPSYAAALLDMVRVLRPGGRIGVTAWSARGSEFHDAWNALAESVVDCDAVRAAHKRALPWEEWLSEPDHLRAALVEAGLGAVTVEEIEYPIEMTLAEFLATREDSLTARFLRTTLDAAEWHRFRQQVAAEFHARFRSPIGFTHRALIAVGRA